jgi:hypothetical protein
LIYMPMWASVGTLECTLPCALMVALKCALICELACALEYLTVWRDQITNMDMDRSTISTDRSARKTKYYLNCDTYSNCNNILNYKTFCSVMYSLLCSVYMIF